jgi:acyl-coenzyme A thioesterase PaaI-like protein
MSDQAQRIMQQPSARMCFACGVENPVGLHIKFFSEGADACRAEVTLDDSYQSYPGIAHGGIIATMLDEVMGRAVMAGGNTERFMATAKLEIRYRQRVPLNQPLILYGRIDKDRGRLVTTVGEIRLEDGTVLAEATASLMALPHDEIAVELLDSTAWKVYP